MRAAAPARSDDPKRLLEQVFGYATFRGEQRAAIDASLAGRDSLVLMPTGGGKSICYQIPALLREGVGIVVSPLIALMQDQVAALREIGIAAEFLNSSLDREAQQAIVGALRAGRVELLYLAPERLLKTRTRELLQGAPVSIIAIDEAHCVSQWGHDFRRDYLGLGALAEWFPGVPRMALTATATQRTREEIVTRLALHAPEVFVASFDRPNIRYRVGVKTDGRRQLLGFLAEHRGEAGIVYCLSRKKTESTAAWLCSRGYEALPYHAGLDADTRALHQQRFLEEDGIVIVATIAFGMGIDKPDVRFVAHLDLPKSIESYYQETGRAGRDGESAEAWMIYGLQDVVRLRQMIEASAADETRQRHELQKLDALLGWCDVTGCRRRLLLAYFGDTKDADCGNCDNCLAPPASWDGTEAARKLLSTVYRTGQMFGAAHIVDVLRGEATEKVAEHGHARLSVFGIGAGLGERTWRSVVRQLIVQGYLRPDPAYGGLALTERARPLLRGEVSVRFREDAAPGLATQPRDDRKPSTSTKDCVLWDALRECRRRLASEHKVPPYVIFHDATLEQMMEFRPTSARALLGLSGVGQAKLERYGEAFLAVIRELG